MAIGLGVPRETLRLVRGGDVTREARLVTNQTAIDLTDQMNAYAERRVIELGREDLSGYVLKRIHRAAGWSGCASTDLPEYPNATDPACSPQL